MEGLNLLRFLVYATAILPFVCGIVLLITAGKMRARYFLAVALLIVGCFFYRAVFWDGAVFPLYGIVLGVRSTLSGALLAMFFTLFPVEFIIPGWLNLRHTLKYLIPFFTCILLYAISLLCGVEYRMLTSLAEVVQYAGEFNVWIRLIFFAVSLGYGLLIFWIPFRVNRFIKIKRWILCYSFGSLGITAVYAWVVLMGHTWSIVAWMIYLLLFSLLTTFGMLGEGLRKKRPLRRFKEKDLFR